MSDNSSSSPQTSPSGVSGDETFTIGGLPSSTTNSSISAPPQAREDLSQQQRVQQTHSPYGDMANHPTINHRVLLSLRESAKVIGTKGSTIQRIRETNHVKIGLSEKQLGCSDRVLSCAGRMVNVCNSLGDVVAILTEGPRPTHEEKRYAFHFLNPILPPPRRTDLKDPEQITHIGTLRLMVTNSQLSSVIGKGGARIKALKEKHDVKIVASRDFLPDSDERILEMQGFPGSITNAVLEISEILLNELGINFTSERRYYPHLRSSPPDERILEMQGFPGSITNAVLEISEILLNELGINFTSERRYYPHLRSSPPSAAATAATASNIQVDSANYFTNEFRAPLKIPESYVGAIVGRQGNRIANLRKFSKTKIIVEKKSEKSAADDPDPENRMFIILGDHLKNVKLAESMLLKNLDVEIEKRQARLAKNSSAANRSQTKSSTDANSSPSQMHSQLQSPSEDNTESSPPAEY
ncbi:related to Heterogeneous nuclear rnp K-like protein 2 [Zygosaccharomyces bailii ISA1307]|nr:related to Heterogeneous nuclear rnp K-like protein 2 [Zygosaccharomyces bailii ISA1307]